MDQWCSGLMDRWCSWPVSTRPLVEPRRINTPDCHMTISYVYVLFSLKDFRTYVGSTNDLARRVDEHNAGRVKSTFNRRPLKLIYHEQCPCLMAARQRELFYKSRHGRQCLKRLINSDCEDIKKQYGSVV